MEKTAYVFPGQGAQFSGMGRDLCESYSLAREMFTKACTILGFDIMAIMFEGSDEDLRSTKVTQPAIFLHSVIKAACAEGFRPDMVAGHSLGEFSALTAAGALGFEDGLRLVAARASAMQKCCESVPGTMAAVIGLEDRKVAEICAGVDGIVAPANFNCPGQIVISGEKEAVGKACEALKEAGARRAMVLGVGGAFHSPLMEPARAELAKAIEATAFNVPGCPVYQNVSAKAETDPVIIKANLLKQLTAPVLWTESVRAMISDGATKFVEIGPGDVLKGLVRRIASADGKEIEIS